MTRRTSSLRTVPDVAKEWNLSEQHHPGLDSGGRLGYIRLGRLVEFPTRKCSESVERGRVPARTGRR